MISLVAVAALRDNDQDFLSASSASSVTQVVGISSTLIIVRVGLSVDVQTTCSRVATFGAATDMRTHDDLATVTVPVNSMQISPFSLKYDLPFAPGAQLISGTQGNTTARPFSLKYGLPRPVEREWVTPAVPNDSTARPFSLKYDIPAVGSEHTSPLHSFTNSIRPVSLTYDFHPVVQHANHVEQRSGIMAGLTMPTDNADTFAMVDDTDATTLPLYQEHAGIVSSTSTHRGKGWRNAF